MSTDTTDGRTTDNPQTEEAADSAAERLGGPSEREQRLEGRAKRRPALVDRRTPPRRTPTTLDPRQPPTAPPKSAPP